MRTSEQLRALIAAETTAIREYRAMPQTQILLSLLDALAEDVMHELATVEPDKLRYKQGQLAQLQALRAAIGTDDPHRTAKAP